MIALAVIAMKMHHEMMMVAVLMNDEMSDDGDVTFPSDDVKRMKTSRRCDEMDLISIFEHPDFPSVQPLELVAIPFCVFDIFEM